MCFINLCHSQLFSVFRFLCNDVHAQDGCHGSDHMVVGFITTYAISAYHHWCCEFESRSGRSVENYVIKFVGDLRLVGGLLHQ